MRQKPETTAKPSLPIAIISLLATGALLGISANLAKVADNVGISPFAFLTWSIFGAALGLSAYAWLRNHWPHLSRHTLVYFIIAALVSVALPNLIMFSAVPYVGAGFVALAFTFPPLVHLRRCRCPPHGTI